MVEVVFCVQLALEERITTKLSNRIQSSVFVWSRKSDWADGILCRLGLQDNHRLGMFWLGNRFTPNQAMSFPDRSLGSTTNWSLF